MPSSMLGGSVTAISNVCEAKMDWKSGLAPAQQIEHGKVKVDFVRVD